MELQTAEDFPKVPVTVIPLEVSLVPPTEVERIWDRVSHMLKRASDLSFGRYRLRDIRAKLETGEFNLWIIFERDTGQIVAAITSAFTHYPQMKSLHGQFLGGDRIMEWRDKFCEVFDGWGRDNGCSKVEFTGRAGWKKMLAENGYRETYRVYEKDLK